MAVTAKTVAVPSKPDYGLDEPKFVRQNFIRGIGFIFLAIAIWYMNRTENPSGGLALFCVFVIAGLGFLAIGGMMVWSSRQGKLQVRDQMLDALPWRGDEKVLDVGVGRGLMLVGAAKRLKTGKVTAVDIWSGEDMSANNAELALGNAKAEGVADKVKIENSDARRLPYPAATYDTIVSGLALHHISDKAERAKALNEMLRVAKPGGYIAIYDVQRTGEYIKHFETAGAEILTKSGTNWMTFAPSQWFVARKK
jgi:arsenite methyltransferase